MVVAVGIHVGVTAGKEEYMVQKAWNEYREKSREAGFTDWDDYWQDYGQERKRGPYATRAWVAEMEAGTKKLRDEYGKRMRAENKTRKISEENKKKTQD